MVYKQTSGIRAGSSLVVDLLISELILDLCCHGFLENLCAYLSTCLLFLSLVAFTKSFLKLFGLITCDNNYLCYTVLTAIKARDSCLWYLDSGCSKIGRAHV